MIDNIGMPKASRSHIDKIIDRGEKLDIIVDKTDALADTADVHIMTTGDVQLFRSDAQKLKCEMLKQKFKLYGIAAAILIVGNWLMVDGQVIILIIVLSNSG